MMKTKWFDIDMLGGEFFSVREAKTIKEAFDKSFEKWELIIQGFFPTDEVDTCGLCDLYNSDSASSIDAELIAPNDCTRCPIYKKTGEQYCAGTPFKLYEHENEATLWKLIAKKELAFLRKIAKSILK